MNVSLSTNRCAGFSRIKVFACILAILVIGDILFRSSQGLRSFTAFKNNATTTNPPPPITAVVPPPNPVATPQHAPETPPAIAEKKSAKPSKKTTPRVGPGGDAGGLVRGTADEKDLAPVSWPRNSKPHTTNPPPVAVPLPIALPN